MRRWLRSPDPSAIMLRMNKLNRGLSLVEVMIAMAVILVGLAGVTSSLIFGLRAGHHGELLTDATNLARLIIETEIGRDYISSATDVDGDNMPGANSGLNDAAGVTRAIDAFPFEDDFMQDLVGTTSGRSTGHFERHIEVTRLGASGTPEEFLATMTVTISWEEKGVDKDVTMSAIVPHTRAQ